MDHPFLANEFTIHWSQLTPEHIEKDIEYALVLAEERLQAIRDVLPEKATFENTFHAWENASVELNRSWRIILHLDSVSNSDAQRKAVHRVRPKVSAFYNGLSLDLAIWNVLKAYSEGEAVFNLTEVEKRFVDETCKYFILSGANLEKIEKEKVAKIDAKLSEITQKFAENTLDSTHAWELIIDDASRLEGIPEMFCEGARLDALGKGFGSAEDPQWRFTLQQTSYFPVLQHADDELLRKEIWLGLNTIGFKADWDNTELIWQILERRQKKAILLGKESFSDLVLEQSMAKTGAAALAFINDLYQSVYPTFLQDREKLIAYKAEKTNTAPIALEPWETMYWAEKMRSELYDFDEQELRSYFEISQVMKGLFEICSQLFNIRIEERETYCGHTPNRTDCVEVWHEDCGYYELYDKSSDMLLGSFYADWHPREGKRGGAWMNPLFTGGPETDGTHIPHVGIVAGNLTKPVGDQPALLNHREVETIFHELGHLLHHLLSRSSMKSLGGTRVPRDFVELPSQLLENWCSDRSSLDLFAKHYQTGETIPNELFKKMIDALKFRSSVVFIRHLELGRIDLELHLNYEKYAGKNLDDVDEEILKDFRILPKTKTPTYLRKFNHIFSHPTGYAAAFYSYKWAEVLDADVFTRFLKEGILNPEVGMAFRKEILSVGNSRPVDESYRKFMGRDPELEPLLRRFGIIEG